MTSDDKSIEITGLQVPGFFNKYPLRAYRLANAVHTTLGVYRFVTREVLSLLEDCDYDVIKHAYCKCLPDMSDLDLHDANANKLLLCNRETTATFSTASVEVFLNSMMDWFIPWITTENFSATYTIVRVAYDRIQKKHLINLITTVQITILTKNKIQAFVDKVYIRKLWENEIFEYDDDDIFECIDDNHGDEYEIDVADCNIEDSTSSDEYLYEGEKEYFVEIPLIPQLESLFQRSGFFNKLRSQYRTNEDIDYSDIYDGSIYRDLTKNNNILSDKHNISFMWYTDGVRIFRSSKFNIWGFFLIILELPYRERYKIQNMLLVSLWFGDHKPEPNLFLKPLRKSLKKVYQGVEFFIKDLDSVAIVRGIVLCGTADLPAKALFLCMNQYNGHFGCQVCFQNGETVERVRVYPHDENIFLRSDESVLENAKQALEINQPVCGVKGPSIISKISHKFITSTAIDVMHSAFEGVARKLIELWFDPKFKNEKFNYSSLVEVVHQKLCSIKPPSSFARRPRSIKLHFAYYKASELKSWCLYYSIPVLRGILPDEIINHYAYFVYGIYTLSKASISHREINLAEKALNEFSSRFPKIYRLRDMSCNLHSIRHLPEIVRCLGPLWVTSYFALEDINGKIKSFVHGSMKPELQIVFNLDMYVKVHTLKYEWLKNDSAASEFCKTLICLQENTMRTVKEQTGMNHFQHIQEIKAEFECKDVKPNVNSLALVKVNTRISEFQSIKIEFECKNVKPNINLSLPVKMNDWSHGFDEYNDVKISDNFATNLPIKTETENIKQEFFDDTQKCVDSNIGCKLIGTNMKNYLYANKEKQSTECDASLKTFCDEITMQPDIDSVNNSISYSRDICTKSLKHKGALKVHIDSLYVHNGRKSHECDICGKLLLYFVYNIPIFQRFRTNPQKLSERAIQH
uniref:Transposase domain-containing protein n=1 Tax=Trichogramma kaykai TaxID=54128 RepID=A0ABD2W1U7_9HYME